MRYHQKERNYILISAPGVLSATSTSSLYDFLFGVPGFLPVPFACFKDFVLPPDSTLAPELIPPGLKTRGPNDDGLPPSGIDLEGTILEPLTGAEADKLPAARDMPDKLENQSS